MNSHFQYIRELGQEEIKSNKFKCKSKATNELDSQKVIHDNKPRKSLLWQWFGYQRQLLYDFVNLSIEFLQNFLFVREAIHFCIKLFHSVFHPISRILKVGLAKLGSASFFKPLLGVWISHETLYLVFDIDIFGEMTLDETCVSFLTLLLQ